jgi:hypothetical protein
MLSVAEEQRDAIPWKAGVGGVLANTAAIVRSTITSPTTPTLTRFEFETTDPEKVGLEPVRDEQKRRPRALASEKRTASGRNSPVISANYKLILLIVAGLTAFSGAADIIMAAFWLSPTHEQSTAMGAMDSRGRPE